MPNNPPYAAIWQVGSGNWFTAGDWLVSDPNFNQPVARVPTTTDAANISGSNPNAPITVAYNGTDEIWSLGGSNANLNITGGSLTVDHDGFLSGAINLSTGTTLSVGVNATQTYFAGTIAGTLAGAGTIQFEFGAFTLNAGTNLSVANLILGVYGNGTVSTTTLNTDLTYGGHLTIVDYSGNNAVLNLNGHTLTLNGPATLDGTITGPGKVVLHGATTEPAGYGGNSIVGGATLEAASGASITQLGTVFIGDATTNGTLQVDAGATYIISSIASISSAAGGSLFLNNGTLVDQAAGATASTLDGGFTNNGTLTVVAGAMLTFRFPGSGFETLAGTINGDGTMSFANGANAKINTATISIANWTISDGTTTFGVDLTYAKNFNFSAQFGTLALNTHTVTLSGTSVLSGSVSGAGRIKVTGTDTLGALTFGTGAAATLEDAGAITQNDLLTLNGTLLIDAAATYTIANAPYGGGIAATGGGATITNNGALSDTAPGTATINGAFANSGSISIASGSMLNFSGTQTFGGTISGAGTLAIGFAAQATINTANITVANIYINGGNGGGTTTLGTNLAYADTFGFVNQFGTLALAGHTLTLSGTSTFAGAINGAGTVKITGAGTIQYLNFGSTTAGTLEDAGSITQTDGLTLNGALKIDAGATYTIANNGITSSGAGATTTNNGTLTRSGTGLSNITGTFINNGALSIASGATLNFSGTQTFGGTISGAGTLGIGFGAQATINTANVTVANIYINGGNGGGTTTLGTNLAYAGTFGFVNQFGTLALAGHTLTLSGTSSFTGAVSGAGTVKVTGTGTLGYLTFGGATAATLEDAGSITQDNPLTLNGTLKIDVGATYTITNTPYGGGVTGSGGGATVMNSGTFVDQASGSAAIGAAFQNDGVLRATGGALILQQAVTGAGSAFIDGHGGLVFQSSFSQNVTFQGWGTLSLAQAYTGVVSGFGVGDAVDLASIGYAAGEKLVLQSTAAGVQTWAVENAANSVLATVKFTAASSNVSRAKIVNDGSGHAMIAGPTGAVHEDFNADSRSDILFRNAAGVTYLYTMNGATVTAGATTSVQVGTNWQIKGVADFNGDGTADLLFAYYNSSNASDPLNGVSYVSFQNGAAATGGGVVQQLPAVWQVAGTGDFNGDGMADVLYRNSATGQAYLDIMNGSSVNWAASGFTSQQVTDPNWHVAGVADFNGDGNADVLWRYNNASNASDALNGTLYEWQMNGTGVSSAGLLSQQAGKNWQVAGTGDFNGDGRADILFRYQNAANAADTLNGFTYIDFMNGAAVTSGAPTQWQVDNSWAIASIGDYNGDGMSDILLQQTSTGKTYEWQMNGANVTSGAFTSSQAGTGWSVQNGVLIG